MKNKVEVSFIVIFIFCLSFLYSQQLKDVEITIYNQNIGLVKEKRELELKKGVQEVKIVDVAAQIEPTSVHFKSLTAPKDCVVLEQNFDYDLISQSKLLEKYIDKEIELKEYIEENNKQVEKTKKGILLSIRDGKVVKIGDKIYLNPSESIVLPELPEGLITKPTLSWLVSNNKEGTHLVEISYLTNGINWDANYVLVVDREDKSLEITGWVTIDNNSGATYKNAKLKLVAGDIHRVKPEYAVRRDVLYKAAFAETAQPQFKEEEFFEYHIYTLQRRTDIKDNEKKQIEFVQASNVAVKKLYIYDGAKFSWTSRVSTADDLYTEKCNKKVWVILEFKNSKENNLGIPLPKGKIRVYKKDEEEMLQFIGEDQIDHTPKDEVVRVYVGNAFDIVGERKLLDKKVGNNWSELSIEIRIRNKKKENINIKVVEHHFTENWKVLESSHKYEKVSADTMEFNIDVAKEKEEVINYKVKYWW